MELKFRYLIMILAFNAPVFGQGFSFTEYYSPEYYNAHIQNWDAVQDTNGFLHFANGTGVLTFDGVKWVLNHIGESGRGVSFFTAQNGQVYVSGQSDFGILKADSLNQIQFHSLAELNDDSSIPIHIETHEWKGSIFFRHPYGLNEYNDNELIHHKIDGDTLQGHSILTGDSLLIGSKRGLISFTKEKGFRFIAGSEFLKGDITWFSFQEDSSTIILGNRDNLLTRFDGKLFTSFPTEADEYLRVNVPYDGLKVGNDIHAIATLSGGVVFINNEGHLLKIFNENTGLASNSVYDLFIDNERLLWINMLNGIQKLHLNENIIHYGAASGLNDAVINMAFTDDKIWVNTILGMYVSERQIPEKVLKFKSVNLPFGYNSLLFNWKNGAYILLPDGLYELNGDRLGRKLISEIWMVKAETLPEANLRFLTSNRVIEFDGESLKIEELNVDVDYKKALAFQDDLFLLNRANGVYKQQDNVFIRVPIEKDSTIKTTYNHIGFIDSTIYVGADGVEENASFLKYDSKRNRFIKSTFFEDNLEFNSFKYKNQKYSEIYNFQQCSDEEIWFSGNMKLIRAYKNERDWGFQEAPFGLIKRPDGTQNVEVIHCRGNGVWFGTTQGLFHLKSPELTDTVKYKTNITGVFANQDSMIYGGFGEPSTQAELAYADNQLRFTYAAASYISPEDNQYQVKLDGFESKWSEWTSETQKDYTNIPEGHYTFQVRSKNIYNVEGSVDTFSFIIHPPWYRTWWAYLIYTFTIAGILYIAYRIRVNQLLRVERIRNSIASDLHDEVSATLSSISYFAQAAKSDKARSNPERFIDLIFNSAIDAKEKISDIVWAINPEHDQWQSFLSKCRRFASDLLESKGIKYSLKIAEDIPGNLDMQLRQHLWLIYKEMVTNAARHSEAKNVNVIFNYEDGILNLIVQDDGKGMDVDTVKKGNGLVNIQKRVDEIKGKILLTSEPDFGTRWVLKVPI